MTTVEDIEKAVAKLPPHELAAFRAWFEAFDAARFDEKIERNAASGKLDRIADEAAADYRAGRAREIGGAPGELGNVSDEFRAWWAEFPDILKERMREVLRGRDC